MFLLFFWGVAELALGLEEVQFLAQPRVILESPHPENQIAELPEEPLDPHKHAKLLASGAHQ